MIYLDNAATTYKKPESVVRAVKKCIKKYSANPGRGAHRLSIMAGEAVYDARERISRFFNTDFPERVVFTCNTTHALNLAIKAFVKPGDHVLISNLEHNSVLRPLHKLKETIGAEYSVFNALSNDLRTEIVSHIRSNTKVIICTAASNVIGKQIPLDVLADVKREYNLKLIIDAAQAAGHRKIDLGAICCDAFCFPAHKAMLGIMGTGGCIFGSDCEVESLMEGGSGTSSKSLYMPTALPEAVEAGTLGLPGIVALNAGIEFVENYGIFEVERRINYLTELLVERVASVNGTKIIGADHGVVSFLMRDMGSEQTAALLDKHGICTRAGLHCAPLAHHTIGTLESGTVRASLSIFTTKKDIDALYQALKKI